MNKRKKLTIQIEQIILHFIVQRLWYTPMYSGSHVYSETLLYIFFM